MVISQTVLWGTDPLYLKTNGQYYYYQNDHLGTPQKLMSKSGAVVWSAQTSSFGETSIDSGSSIQNPLRFPGQYYDQETGLHYNYQRYYDPATGKYISTDPIGMRGGLNPYIYADVNPVVFADPTGEFIPLGIALYRAYRAGKSLQRGYKVYQRWYKRYPSRDYVRNFLTYFYQSYKKCMTICLNNNNIKNLCKLPPGDEGLNVFIVCSVVCVLAPFVSPL